MIDAVLAWLGSQAGTAFLAGGAGGLLRWVLFRSTWKDGLAATAVGAICAYYLGPLAVPTVEAVLGKVVDDPAEQARLGGFVIGINGLGFAGFILDVVNARIAKGHKEGTDNADPR